MNAPHEAEAATGVEGPWRIVVGVFLANLAGFGGAYTFSAFFGALQAAFGASRGEVSLAFSLAAFLYFALGLVSGRLADRWGARPLMIAGVAVMSLGLGLSALARTLTEVYAAYGLGIGLGVGLAYVPGLGAVQKAFHRRRGLASGIATAGIGAGTLLMPPLAAWLIAAIGWRASYGVLGGVTLALGLAAVWLVVPPAGPPVRPEAGLEASRPATLRSAAFRRLYLACLLAGAGAFLPFAHLAPYAGDQGLAPERAALLIAALGVGSTAGRFLVGDLADRLGRRRSLLVSFAGMGICLASWPLAHGFAGLAAFALFYGLVYGGWVALLPAHVADLFGAQHAGGVIGALYTGVALGALIGPSAAGWIFDHLGAYAPVLFAAAVANLVAAWLAASPRSDPASA